MKYLHVSIHKIDPFRTGFENDAIKLGRAENAGRVSVTLMCIIKYKPLRRDWAIHSCLDRSRWWVRGGKGSLVLGLPPLSRDFREKT